MNKKTMLILMLLFFVFSIIIGKTYSYYVPKITGNPTELTTKLSNRGVEVNYENGSNLLIDSSNTTVTKNITIKNNNATAVDYLLYFYDVNNSLVDKAKLTYSYTCTGVGCNTRTNIQAPSNEGPLSLYIPVSSGVTHTYEITFSYDGTPSGSFIGRLEVIKPIIYGLAINGDRNGTRTDDAVGKNVSINADNKNINSDFDTAEIYKEMVEVTDSYGNQFIKVPKFYIKKTKTAPTYWTYQVSKTKVDDNYYLSESFKNPSTGDILDYVLVGRYEARINGTKLESKRGANPAVSQTISTFRTYAMNNGPSYHLMDIHIVDVINTLAFIEFGTVETQQFLFGYTTFGLALKSCGTTDSVTAASGSAGNTTNGLNAMRYRYIENWYGHIWKFVDGVNVRNRQIYVAKNHSNYASDVFTGDYQLIGYAGGATNGWAYELGYDINYPFVNITTDIRSKSTDTMYRDYYQQETGDRELVFGGSMQNGLGYAGINFWDFASASSNSSNRLGARLIKKAY